MLSLRSASFVLVALLVPTTPASALSTAVYTQTYSVRQLGYVAEFDSLHWSHTFQPLADRILVSVDRVSLSITLSDDTCRHSWQCLRDRLWSREYASLSLRGLDWRAGSATSAVFESDVTSVAALLDHDGILDVLARSVVGDFRVVSSVLTVEYSFLSRIPGGSGPGEPEPAPAVPEPHAVLLFSTGLLCILRATSTSRRRAASG